MSEDGGNSALSALTTTLPEHDLYDPPGEHSRRSHGDASFHWRGWGHQSRVAQT